VLRIFEKPSVTDRDPRTSEKAASDDYSMARRNSAASVVIN